MNCTTDKWIPVLRSDGTTGKASLLDVFTQGADIRDLSCRPHERVALMRLLICVAQAALDGPRDYEEWSQCLPRLPDAVAAYLARWRHAFELFGDGPRFLQVEHVRTLKAGAKDGDEANSPSKLDLALATGNNTTLFDNAGGSDRKFPHDALALALLTFQAFSPCGRIGNVDWNGTAMGGSSTNAPCVDKAMLHTYVTRASLLTSVHANLMSRAQIGLLGHEWGKPLWEQMPDAPGATTAVKNATESYLGRLVPISRAIRLDSDRSTLLLGAGLVYDQEWREPAATWVVRERDGKPQRTPLNASVSKSVWREAHSISVLTKSDSDHLGGPIALQSLAPGESADVWCGALVANKSKLLDAVESVLHIPAPMFEAAGQTIYRDGVAVAEMWGRRINRAVANCRKELHDDLDKAELRRRGNLVKQKAASHYWTAIEQKVPLLIELVKDPTSLYPAEASKPQWGATPWGKALASAAREAYELACPRSTPRQLKAYAAGLRVLFRQEPETETGEDATDEESEA